VHGFEVQNDYDPNNTNPVNNEPSGPKYYPGTNIVYDYRETVTSVPSKRLE
jgi:hypothetical protein